MASQIGDIIDIYCSRCRLNLDGSVAALSTTRGGETKVAKVTCRTCGNESRYRAPVDVKAKQQKALDRLMRQKEKARQERSAPAPVEAAPDALRALWDELTDKVDARYAKVYDPTGSWEPEAAILHKQFGMGIVHNVDADGTMNVLFRTGFQNLASRQEPDLDD